MNYGTYLVLYVAPKRPQITDPLVRAAEGVPAVFYIVGTGLFIALMWGIISEFKEKKMQE
jgi:hypothetical protein